MPVSEIKIESKPSCFCLFYCTCLNKAPLLETQWKNIWALEYKLFCLETDYNNPWLLKIECCCVKLSGDLSSRNTDIYQRETAQRKRDSNRCCTDTVNSTLKEWVWLVVLALIFTENENKTNNLGNFQIHELGKD